MSSALFVLVCAACSDGGADLGPSATVGTAPVTTTSSPTVDPSVIPTDPTAIDEAYVQAVVDALFAVDAKATKIFVETKDITNEEALGYLRAIYVPEELDRQVNIWFQDLALGGDELLPGVLENDVQRLIDIAPDCLYVSVESDYSAVTTRNSVMSMNYLGLTPKREGDDPQQLNPTTWMLFMDGVNLDGSEPESPCEGR
ncbi:MAG TPA: hypothetical protein VK988_04350 [Acidimicrobiales bacterium]|nr:hypothetical protein [Acidimicrobiales bacterium]